jgi:hypothetical protein
VPGTLLLMGGTGGLPAAGSSSADGQLPVHRRIVKPPLLPQTHRTVLYADSDPVFSLKMRYRSGILYSGVGIWPGVITWPHGY